MAKIPGISGWLLNIDLVVWCKGCETHAIVRLNTYAPEDPPVCPMCGTRLVCKGRARRQQVARALGEQRPTHNQGISHSRARHARRKISAKLRRKR